MQELTAGMPTTSVGCSGRGRHLF